MQYWFSRRPPTWDKIPALLGGLLLLSELSPLPIFTIDFESIRVLVQFPLIAIVLLGAMEKRLFLTLSFAAALSVAQSFHGIDFALRGLWSAESLVAPVGWMVWFGSLLVPSRLKLYSQEAASDG